MVDPLPAAAFPTPHPSGSRAQPPRYPPAPPAAGSTPPGGHPDPLPDSLLRALGQCLLWMADAWTPFELAAMTLEELVALGVRMPGGSPATVADLARALQTVAADAGRARTALRQALRSIYRHFVADRRTYPDANDGAVKARVLSLCTEGVAHAELNGFFRAHEPDTPFFAPLRYHLPVPAGLSPEALALLPPRSVVRWTLEALMDAAAAGESYSGADPFLTRISRPLLALIYALWPGDGPYAPLR